MGSISSVSDEKDEIESNTTTNDEEGIKDDLHFSWDDLPDKVMRDEYKLQMPSSTVPVSKETKVIEKRNLSFAIS